MCFAIIAAWGRCVEEGTENCIQRKEIFEIIRIVKSSISGETAMIVADQMLCSLILFTVLAIVLQYYRA